MIHIGSVSILSCLQCLVYEQKHGHQIILDGRPISINVRLSILRLELTSSSALSSSLLVAKNNAVMNNPYKHVDVIYRGIGLRNDIPMNKTKI